MKFERNCCLVKDDSLCVCFHQELVLTIQNAGKIELSCLELRSGLGLEFCCLEPGISDIWSSVF